MKSLHFPQSMHLSVQWNLAPRNAAETSSQELSLSAKTYASSRAGVCRKAGNDAHPVPRPSPARFRCAAIFHVLFRTGAKSIRSKPKRTDSHQNKSLFPFSGSPACAFWKVKCGAGHINYLASVTQGLLHLEYRRKQGSCFMRGGMKANSSSCSRRHSRGKSMIGNKSPGGGCGWACVGAAMASGASANQIACVPGGQTARS